MDLRRRESESAESAEFSSTQVSGSAEGHWRICQAGEYNVGTIFMVIVLGGFLVTFQAAFWGPVGAVCQP